MASRLTLADLTGHVDGLIKKLAPGLIAIINTLTAEDPHVAALVDHSDDEALQICEELGQGALRKEPNAFTALDIQQAALDRVLREHNYVPIDEIPDYCPGTVVLYVLTRGVAVARRFEKGSSPITELREVVRTRDIEIQTSLSLEGRAAEQVLLQKCTPMLKRLWERGSDCVGLIRKASHGAKVGFFERDTAIEMLRSLAGHRKAEPEIGRIVESFAARGAQPGVVHCIFSGWGLFAILDLDAASLGAAGSIGRAEEDVLHGWIVACRDQKRALGMFEKCLDKVGPSATAAAPLADLLSLLRHRWEDCAAILAQINQVNDAAIPICTTPAGKRLVGALLALTQATTERQRGGPINAPLGGKA